VASVLTVVGVKDKYVNSTMLKPSKYDKVKEVKLSL
jgi:hypothetical protein